MVTDKQLRAIYAKGGLESRGTLPIKMTMKQTDPRAKFDIERIVGTDNVIVRKRGESTGTITTRDDLDRVIKGIEQRQKMQKLLEQKLKDTKRRSKLTDTQLRQIEQMQREVVRNA